MHENEESREPCRAILNVESHLRSAEHRLKRAHRQLRMLADWTEAYLGQYEHATSDEGFTLAREARAIVVEDERP